MAHKLESMHDLLVHELRDLYSAEKQITRALPKMMKAASSEKLKTAFEEHLEVTNVQIERLEEIFAALEVSSRGPKCAAMEGLVEEGSEIIEHKKEADPAVLTSVSPVTHGFDELIGAVFGQVCHFWIVSSYWTPGSPQVQVPSAILSSRSRAR